MMTRQIPTKANNGLELLCCIYLNCTWTRMMFKPSGILQLSLPDPPTGLWYTLVSVATIDADSRFVFLVVDTFQRVNNKRSPLYDSSWNCWLESKRDEYKRGNQFQMMSYQIRCIPINSSGESVRTWEPSYRGGKNGKDHQKYFQPLAQVVQLWHSILNNKTIPISFLIPC